MAKTNNRRVGSSRTALEARQAEIDVLFTSIGEAAIVIDELGKISRVNPVALQLLGYEEEELVGQWFSGSIQAFSEDGQLIDALDRPIVRAFLEGKAIAQKMYYATKSGKLLAVSINVSPVFHDGHPLGAIEIFRDVTRDNEIDRMKSEFISLASHQLRTPLTAIQTYAHLLASGFRGSLTKQQHEFMDIILSSVDRMNDLITTLLDISRIEAGKLNIEQVKIDINLLSKTVVQQLRQTAADKQIAVHYQPLPRSVYAYTDPLLLAEAYANLFSNAIKYTPKLGTITISLESDETVVTLVIKDTGVGIPHDLHDQVFSKFFRAPNVAKKDTTGTGLGLYMVRQIAENLGGKTWFSSHEGRGSSFYFQIPRHPTNSDVDA